MTADQRTSEERVGLLADVAEMYFFQDKTQAQIAKKIGVTRSMVSRLLTEARRQNIVEITVHRPLSFDRELQTELARQFGLRAAFVLGARLGDSNLLKNLGEAAAHVVKEYFQPNMVLGLPWGTTVSSAVDALEVEEPIPCKITQMVGALGSRNLYYDGHGIVQRLAEKLGGEAYYLNAPFLVDSEQTANALYKNPSICETLSIARRCTVALLGIGSTDPDYSSYYKAGYLSLEELNEMRSDGAVGGVCGIHFDSTGNLRSLDFQRRMMSIDEDSLKTIPVRIGVAGGLGKIDAIQGAILGGYINIIVTDHLVASALLRRTNHES
ncbi:MAG TPA: sugar-binding transcriptional regulator [Longilinea sp.]|nr:sugar-binding transcriptional regulator [Longilinea sp.]